jgi:hypothetical protein
MRGKKSWRLAFDRVLCKDLEHRLHHVKRFIVQLLIPRLAVLCALLSVEVIYTSRCMIRQPASAPGLAPKINKEASESRGKAYDGRES